MLTLFHAPFSRSSRIVSLIHEMGIEDRVRIHPVTIRRQDGSGQADPGNPHPEAKAPALLVGDTLVTESAAVILTLTTMFPGTGIAPNPGDPDYPAYLTWLFWYGNVVEPVLICRAAGLSHLMLTDTFRGEHELAARLSAALAKGPWLLGARYSAADLLLHSPFAWFPAATPDDPAIQDWVARCKDRPAVARMRAGDTALAA